MFGLCVSVSWLLLSHKEGPVAQCGRTLGVSGFMSALSAPPASRRPGASPQWLSGLGTLFHTAIVLGMEAVSTLQPWTVCLVGGLKCQDAFRLKYL